MQIGSKKLQIKTDRIVGAYFGGFAAGRGTCNHLVVEEGHRRHKLASHLVSHALPIMFDKGVRTVHIMTTAGNNGAFDFWEKQGFKHNPADTFLEADID